MLPSARTRIIVFSAAWLTGLFLLLPGLITIPVSLNDSRFIAMPQQTLSLRHFEALLSGTWLSSMGESAIIALVTTAVSVLLGTACAIGMWRLSGQLAMIISALVLAPMILPAIVSGLALYRMWVVLGLYDTWAGVIIAHTIIALPFVVITVTTSLSMMDPRLEQASRSLGASPRTTALRVILPNIQGGVLTGAVFAFITSWDEIVVTLFVSTRAVYTLPRRMWDGIRENIDPTVAAVATVLIAATTIVIAGALIQMLRQAQTSRAL
jgi:putative spermidine/putrescine transport system permease protein